MNSNNTKQYNTTNNNNDIQQQKRSIKNNNSVKIGGNTKNNKNKAKNKMIAITNERKTVFCVLVCTKEFIILKPTRIVIIIITEASTMKVTTILFSTK